MKGKNKNPSVEGEYYARCAQLAAFAEKQFKVGRQATTTIENAIVTTEKIVDHSLHAMLHNTRKSTMWPGGLDDEEVVNNDDAEQRLGRFMLGLDLGTSDDEADAAIADSMTDWCQAHRPSPVLEDEADSPRDPDGDDSGEEHLPGCDAQGVVTDPVWLSQIQDNIKRMDARSKLKSCIKRSHKGGDDNAWAGPAVDFGEDEEMTYEVEEKEDPMDIDNYSSTTESWEQHKSGLADPVRTAGGKAPGRTWRSWVFDQLGLSSWRDKRQNQRDAAHALASTRAYDCMDDEHVEVEPKVKTFEFIQQKIDLAMGKRKYNVHHRSANRYNRRLAMIKTLVEELKATSPGVFTKTEADKRALHLCAKQVVEGAWTTGVEMGLGNEKRKIRRQERSYYIRAVCIAYHLGGDDDAFWAALESGTEPPLA